MMGKKNIFILNSERGSISLGIMMGILGAVLIIVMQITTSFGYLGLQHKQQKNILKNRQAMLIMAQKFKQAYNLGQLDSSCHSFLTGGTAFYPRTINGMNFCFPHLLKICVDTTEIGVGNIEICASNRAESLAWTSSGLAGGPPALNNGSGASGHSAPENAMVSRIRIPDPSDPYGPWQRCDDGQGGCVRIALCERGVTDCTLTQATSTQIVRIGPIN